MLEATTGVKSTPQNVRAIPAATIYTMGITHLAGQRKPTNRIAATKIGADARSAWMLRFAIRPP